MTHRSLLLLTGCRFGMYPGSTDQGRDISNLYRVLFIAAIPIAAIVYGLILWSIIRYRKRRDAEGLPNQIRYHIPLEITYTVIPVLIVIGLFVATLRTENRVDSISPNPAVVLNATAFQWQWSFAYPQYGITVTGTRSATPSDGPTIELPIGETIHVNLASEDVIHAFFVPQFNFKRDVIPGVHNQFDITIPTAGTFRGECAEFCGLNHGYMTFYIRAVPRAEFQAWIASKRAGGS